MRIVPGQRLALNGVGFGKDTFTQQQILQIDNFQFVIALVFLLVLNRGRTKKASLIYAEATTICQMESNKKKKYWASLRKHENL